MEPRAGSTAGHAYGVRCRKRAGTHCAAVAYVWQAAPAPSSDRPLTGRRNGEPLPALCATAFEHGTPVFRGHADEKAVCALAAATVRLKSAFTLHEIPAAVFELRRNVHGSERALRVSIGCVLVRCFTRSQACVTVRSPRETVGSPPEVFHNCGKHCGKARENTRARQGPSRKPNIYRHEPLGPGARAHRDQSQPS
jgi:hypothetical protein